MAKKKADHVSYFWDDLINVFALHALKGSTEYRNWNHILEIEPILRVMASHNRLHRRILSEGFVKFYYNRTPGQRGTRLIYMPDITSVGYVFLLVPYTKDHATLENYRRQRRELLQGYALIYGEMMYSKLSSLIGIAAMTRTSDASLSDDFFDEGQDQIYLECKDWNEDMKTKAKNIRIEYEKLGFFSSITASKATAREFPQ